MDYEKREENRNAALGILNAIMSVYSLNRVSGLPQGIEGYAAVRDSFMELKRIDPALANSLSSFYDTLRSGESQ